MPVGKTFENVRFERFGLEVVYLENVSKKTKIKTARKMISNSTVYGILLVLTVLPRSGETFISSNSTD